MKKTIQKLMAALLAVAMLCAMAIPAFATDGDATADDHVVRVENKAGTVLPSTGGMGTTLFYVIGGGLMVAAIVLLVTKKRMENK